MNVTLIFRYRVASRHWRESQTILPFEFHFPIHDMVKVDAITNEYIVRASIQLIYQFEFLQWNSSDIHSRYYHIDQLILSKSTLQALYLPDIYSIDEELITFQLEHESARLMDNGRMIWTRRGLFTIQSSIDFTYYPFDHQYMYLTFFHRQKTFKLQYQEVNIDRMISSQFARTSNLWKTLFSTTMEGTNQTELYNHSFTTVPPLHQTVLSRGWFVKILTIEPKQDNDTLDNLTIIIYLQRRREPHIYTTILPTLFLSVFIFIYYFSSIESHQRLIMTLSHILGTLLFINYLDRKISADQLPYTPMLIKYLSMVFLIEILSLFFDHIIHSIYYGGIHFVSHWLNKDEKQEHQTPALLSHVALLPTDFHGSNLDAHHGTDAFLKQLIQREETNKHEDYQREQWHKHARLSECLCCWFFFAIILLGFLSMFFILPSLTNTQLFS